MGRPWKLWMIQVPPLRQKSSLYWPSHNSTWSYSSFLNDMSVAVASVMSVCDSVKRVGFKVVGKIVTVDAGAGAGVSTVRLVFRPTNVLEQESTGVATIKKFVRCWWTIVLTCDRHNCWEQGCKWDPAKQQSAWHYWRCRCWFVSLFYVAFFTSLSWYFLS